MKSRKSNISNISWSSSLEDLYPRGLPKTVTKVFNAGFDTLDKLLWLIPNKIQILPPVRKFSYQRTDFLFKGHAKVSAIQAKPNFRAKGKGRALLMNVTVLIKDCYSDDTIELRWFNAYSSVVNKIKKSTYIEFLGTVQEFMGKKQITNPEFETLLESQLTGPVENDNENRHQLKIQYPTINGVSTTHIKKIFQKIPEELWLGIKETLPEEILETRDLLPLNEAFYYIHGNQILDYIWNEDNFLKAKERLIYEELFNDQLKIHLRRVENKKPKAIPLNIDPNDINVYEKMYPYTFTDDQKSNLQEIITDLNNGHPMMRLIQGDVGCGKTTIAVVSAICVLAKNKQVALMCPTESLAFQHFQEIKELLKDTSYNVDLLLGSTSTSEKKRIQNELADGTIHFIIGTHSLFQKSVSFKSLTLAIIDEQHKFGVNQRQELIKKGDSVHCLIMSATPIPRSLSLTQYGDLDISTVKTMPSGRKGHKTRIVNGDTYEKFLSFIATRLSLGEQIYIVVPAINESETQEIQDLNAVLEKYTKFFPDYKIAGLHGQLKSHEKSEKFLAFKNKEIDVLVATSVIEVGINVLNATVIAILNPERFGLSSLHQLRGRVGRGDKPGFCFLVSENQLSKDSLERLMVIEKYTDGFKIAEEDLRIRGEGDVFGTNQSGSNTIKRIANIIIHQNQLIWAREDSERLISSDNPLIMGQLENLQKDINIFSTI